MKTKAHPILLGYEIPTGNPVEIPEGHLAVTGQTQLAGKTTTLEALVERSAVRAIAFVTKRGEGAFTHARSIPPYFTERGDWEFVASILEASQREKMKFERSWIIKVSRGADTLSQVHRNVKKALETAAASTKACTPSWTPTSSASSPRSPPCRRATASKLHRGLNVMDLTAYSIEMQALVIRSVLEWVHEKEEGVVTIIPEAWEFIPQNRGSPVKLAAERLIRKGAGCATTSGSTARTWRRCTKISLAACRSGSSAFSATPTK
jgi:hypothetical protein